MNKAVPGGFHQGDQRFGATAGIHCACNFCTYCVGSKKGG